MDDPIVDFIEAACVPLDADHASGTLELAATVLTAHADLASRSIYAAAILGDAAAVRQFLEREPALATMKGGPREWDALTYLAFSRYLRLDPSRSDGFVDAATALLDAGASANTGWFEPHHQPEPTWESAIYGAAGIARHPELTRLLLARGADPNDDETPYHAPETYDNRALEILVESGKLSVQSLATILLRKTDWHDEDGIMWLLARGVDPDTPTLFGKTALHNAILSDNCLAIIDALLDRGADPKRVATRPTRAPGPSPARSAYAMAARRGRADVLASFARRGVPDELEGVEQLIAACARNDVATAGRIAEAEPELLAQLRAEGGKLLAEFAGVHNTGGVRALLDLGVDVAAPYTEGDGYFGIPKNSLAIHVAAWKMAHATVKLLIERGSPVDVPDANGRTPLALAVRACVDSYWMSRRSPESVEALLAAGASASGIELPTGYEEIDELLRVSTRNKDASRN